MAEIHFIAEHFEHATLELQLLLFVGVVRDELGRLLGEVERQSA